MGDDVFTTQALKSTDNVMWQHDSQSWLLCDVSNEGGGISCGIL